MNQRSNTVQYDDFAETFGQSRRDMHWSEIDEVLSQFIETYEYESGKIADIWCGNGRLLTHITGHSRATDFQKFTTYVWLDASSELLKQASLDISFSDFFSHTFWSLGDMRDLEALLSQHGTFDVIFFIASFHHLSTREDRLSVLEQAKKLLSKNGRIIMTNWNLSHESQWKYQNSKSAEYSDGSADYSIKIGGYNRFYHAFSHEEYVSLAQDTELSVFDAFWDRNSIVIWSK